MQRKRALRAQRDSYDPRIVSWTLLRNDSNCGCGFWDSSRTTLEFPAPNTDELGPVRGIAFAILLAIPCWIAPGVTVWAISNTNHPVQSGPTHEILRTKPRPVRDPWFSPVVARDDSRCPVPLSRERNYGFQTGRGLVQV